MERRKKFPIYNRSSFGFRQGVSTIDAIEAARAARGRDTWCFKTDIESFFDRIPRNYLKDKVKRRLHHSSILPLVLKAIDCEAEKTPEISKILSSQGIKRGEGLRQGMPLSPMLANLTLAEFDKEIERRKIPMIRYADDLVVFAPSRAGAEDAGAVVASLLQELQLHIPRLGSNSKTVLVGPDVPLNFLGYEIVYLETKRGYVSRVSKQQISRICDCLREEYCPSMVLNQNLTLSALNISLARTLAAYRGAYRHASNYDALDGRLRGVANSIVKEVLQSVFGAEVVQNLSSHAQHFLGIDGLHDEIEEAFDDA